ncbi:hypothetical protein BC830DRAFT_166344 [Chytriomyces sp. MP71]|nr:hypothetical protein BC830DRAFT_166344 [Chytriomyces sp. MP71]
MHHIHRFRFRRHLLVSLLMVLPLAAAIAQHLTRDSSWRQRRNSLNDFRTSPIQGLLAWHSKPRTRLPSRFLYMKSSDVQLSRG